MRKVLCLLAVFPALVSGQQCRLTRRNQIVLAPEPPDLPPNEAGRPTSSVRPSAGTMSATPNAPTATGPPQPTQTSFKYGTTPIRGVNLGGWLVLEPWITPSLFEQTNDEQIIDEYTFGGRQDYNTALGVLEAHWATWIDEDDFRAIKAAGLNHIRIPLGYWSVPMTQADSKFDISVTPYVPGAWKHFLNGLNWAKKHGLNVVVDLHGAPGSQNGYDNSGQRGSPGWGQSSNNVARTLEILKFVTANAGGMIDVLELINEPGGWYSADVAAATRQFFLDGYSLVRDTAGGAMKVMISDAFLGVDRWEGFLTYPGAQGVIMDYHNYQIFLLERLSLSWDDHISLACQTGDKLKTFADSNIYTIIGEWSNAPTDCTKWLNGRGVGNRWESSHPERYGQPPYGSCEGFSGSYTTFSEPYKEFLRRYWEVQVHIGERAQGWIYWTWKAENSDEWSYEKGLEAGFIPRDPSERLYPNICG